MKNYFIILLVINVILLITLIIMTCWVFYIPQGVVMIFGYSEMDENGNECYSIDCFNYTYEKFVKFNLEKEAYDKLLQTKGDFYNVYSRGLFGKPFLIKINDEGILCD